MRIQAWAPGHATLLFAAPEKKDNPLQMGSVGLGLNFETGVLTAVDRSESDQVYWNSKKIEGEVTNTALNKFREMTGFDDKVSIHHYSELKIGHGLSTSGAGALGVALTMNRMGDTGLTDQEMYRVAHYADVVNHTGLGSVMGQITGGIEIRKSIGGPGIGETISLPDDSPIIILMMGKLKTSDVLVSNEQMILVNKTGISYLSQIEQNKRQDLSFFLELGHQFTFNCGLMTNRVRNTLEKLSEIDENNATMAMIGETIIVKPNNPERVLRLAQKYRIDTVVTKISNLTPRLINE